MNIDLAWNVTESQVVQYLKSFLEGYVGGNKLEFETKFRFGQWPEGVQAQRELSAKRVSAREKLRWNVQDYPPNYLVIGLGDAIWNILQAALGVNLAIIRCLIETGDVLLDIELITVV